MRNQMITPLPARQLDATEHFFLAERGRQNLAFTIGDFWRWGFSDVQQNILRGILAEFLVAKALNLSVGVRAAWDNYDLQMPNGTRIEVKSGGYLQRWKQRQLSNIVFGRLRGRNWDEIAGFDEKKSVRADVFVFAVQTATDHDNFDPLDVGQWEFYVLPRGVIEARNSETISLNVVRKLTDGQSFAELSEAVQSLSP